MLLSIKRWYRPRTNLLVKLLVILCIVPLYFILFGFEAKKEDRNLIRRQIERSLEEALLYDRDNGCDIPHLDPFAQEVMQFDKVLPKIVCPGKDWVKCYLSECRVIDEILRTVKNVVCYYSDIIHVTDKIHKLGRTSKVAGTDVYKLVRSDHVAVKCTGANLNNIYTSWSGLGTGFRPVSPPPPPPGRKDSYNVLIFGFDSVAKNGFMRKMPKSYKYLKDVVKATILNGYNVVGDGTPAALFPLLTGRTELELPEVRTAFNKNTMDDFPFIFYKVHEDGYRTAFFEDSPTIGTFQYRFNGWKDQPTDHYLRALLMEKLQQESIFQSVNDKLHCIGDTPSYKMMINGTEQFMSLPGKKFIFNFIVDISHDDFNKISTADEDTMHFLKNFMDSGLRENTLLLVMGDHGSRFANVRATLQGKLEERLPLMAVRLPDRLVTSRVRALAGLRRNADVLTTPHDVHATILDVIDMRQHWNTYSVAGADYTRALTLLEPIPRSRSCSAAGVEPHWCACLSWSNVSTEDPLYHRAADKLVTYINQQTQQQRSKCATRTLTSIQWVIVHRVKDGVAKFIGNKDSDGYLGRFQNKADVKETVQVKLTVEPGSAEFEASLSYKRSADRLYINPRDISRIDAYGHEPDCISDTHPHLNPYCYCNQ